MKKIIDGLSRSKLELLYNEWSTTGENSELLKYVGERLQYIEKVNHDFVSHSSDRVVEHTEEDKKRKICELKLGDISRYKKRY